MVLGKLDFHMQTNEIRELEIILQHTQKSIENG
jgi:hypothetical protein